MTLEGEQLTPTAIELGRTSTLRAESVGGAGGKSRKAEGGAAGAGEGCPLVVKGNNSAAPGFDGTDTAGLAGLGVARKRLLADRARRLIAETCGDMPEADKVRGCGVNVTAGLSVVGNTRRNIPTINERRSKCLKTS